MKNVCVITGGGSGMGLATAKRLGKKGQYLLLAGRTAAKLEKAVAEGAELTDDCSAVERLGMPVRLTAGSYENLKLTTPEDIALAESILEGRGEL